MKKALSVFPENEIIKPSPLSPAIIPPIFKRISIDRNNQQNTHKLPSLSSSIKSDASDNSARSRVGQLARPNYVPPNAGIGPFVATKALSVTYTDAEDSGRNSFLDQPTVRRVPLINSAPVELKEGDLTRKPPEIHDFLIKAFSNHFLFAKMAPDVVEKVIDGMKLEIVSKDTMLINEGDEGQNCYVIEQGSFEFYKKSNGNSPINQLGYGNVFGELALLYNCPRTASCKAAEESKVWALDRDTFRSILAHLSSEELKQAKEILKKIRQLQALSEDQLSRVASVVRFESFKEKDIILSPYTISTKVYVIQSGVVQQVPGNTLLGEGSVLGSEALLNKQNQFQFIVKEPTICLCFLISDFNQVVGTMADIMEDKTRIKVLKSIRILQILSDNEFEQLNDSFQRHSYEIGEYLVKQGQDLDHLIIFAEGKCKVTKKLDGISETEIGTLSSEKKEYFGEQSLLHELCSPSNVISLTPLTTYEITRDKFNGLFGSLRELMISHTVLNALKKVPLFSGLQQQYLQQVSRVFKPKVFKKGEFLIIQDTKAEEFFVIEHGVVHVTKNSEGAIIDVGDLEAGAFLGEIGLISNANRTANVIATTDVSVFVLQKSDFQQLCAPVLPKLKETMNIRKDHDTVILQKVDDPMKILTLQDFDTLALLGTGVLGRVTLVQAKRTHEVYALKAMYKSAIMEKKQKDAVIYEKRILMTLDHPFILKLYRTFRDREKVYMLMEYVQGGELYSYLRKCPRHRIRTSKARFYAGSVLLVLEHLQQFKIIHRDLKPENILIDAEGYIKMIDFGFAKELKDKTFTLCGTPEYLAPEVIIGKAYGYSCDYWALGILIYEMLCGNAPFRAPQEDKLFQKITDGVFEFPPKFNDFGAKDLITRLLVTDPNHRFGCLKRGIRDIKDHVWFNGFDFKLLMQRKMEVPWIPNVNNNIDHSNFQCSDPEEPAAPFRSDGTDWDKEFD